MASRKIHHYESPEEKELAGLKLPDLKRQCIMRGYPFSALGESSVLDLQSFFIHNYYKEKDVSLLDKYDDYIEDMVKARNWDRSLIHPDLRLGRIAEKDEDGNITKRKRLGIRIKKKKRKRTSDGLFAGTKKAYTYELVKAKKTKEEIIKLVIEKFPDAKEKSIVIWANRAKREFDGKTKKIQ